MADPDRCPDCGSELPARAPGGLCPRCLLQEVAADEARDAAPEGETAASMGRSSGTGGASILASIAAGAGTIPRIMLHEADDGPGPPVVEPGGGGEALDWLGLPARYELLDEIARGGMGAILKGRDADLGRDLAVKVLLDQHRDRPEMVRRFIEEAQIGGQLQHPGIVPVYELGAFADGRPFFTMKLVKGRTLASQLEAREDLSDDRPRLLSIFLQVCQTMAYAHARGVVHRDLKPSNVMVGRFGEVQVMDWGLAKLLARGELAYGAPAGRAAVSERIVAAPRREGDGDLSRSGSAVGTPAYMAPEQARGEVDAVDERADVFALGSILCEILTGRPAFVGGSSAEIQRRAGRPDLADASSRLDACGADAELIALARSCLAPEPIDRPRDAGVVAERITAYLADVDRRLRRAELARVEERARRRLTTAVAMAVLTVCALAGGGLAWLRHQRAERLAATSRLVDEALDRAAALRGEAAAAPSGELAGWSEAIAEARRADDLLRQGWADPTLRRRADDLLAGLERGQAEARTRAKREDVDRRLLAALVDIGDAEADDPDGSATDAAYAAAFRAAGVDLAALRIAEAGARIRDRPADVGLAMVTALDDWAAMRRGRRHDPAGARRLVEVADAADADPWRARLREALNLADRRVRLAALRELATVARVDALPAISVSLLGSALASTGDLEAAADLLRRALLQHPGEVRLHHELARVLDAMARPEEAIRHYTAARAIRPETAHDLAHLLARRGETDAAMALFRDLARRRPANAFHTTCLVHLLATRGKFVEMGAAIEAAIAANREAIRLRHDDANAYQALGVLQVGWDSEGAIAAFRETIRLMPGEPTARIYVGQVLDHMGRHDEAVEAFREALRLRPDDAEASIRLGGALDAADRYGEAVEAFREALRLEPNGWAAHAGLAVLLLRRGRWQEAAEEYELARVNSARSGNDWMYYFPVLHRSDDDVVWYLSAVAQLRAGRFDRYRGLCREILDRFGDGSGESERVARVCLLRPEESDVIERAIRLAERALRDDPTGKFSLYTAGLAAYRAGSYEAALERLRRSREGISYWGGVFQDTYDALSSLVEAMTLVRLGRTDAGREAFARAERLMAGHLPATDSDRLYPLVWQEWAHCEIIHREARTVVGDCDFPADPFAR